MISGKINILIIDDEELVRRNLRLFIENSGMGVIEAVNGQEGIEAYERYRPDIVLTDLQMPLMDGFRVIEILKDDYPDTPVIVVSNASDVQNAVEALRKGAWDYIVKPVSDSGVNRTLFARHSKVV